MFLLVSERNIINKRENYNVSSTTYCQRNQTDWGIAFAFQHCYSKTVQNQPIHLQQEEETFINSRFCHLHNRIFLKHNEESVTYLRSDCAKSGLYQPDHPSCAYAQPCGPARMKTSLIQFN